MKYAAYSEYKPSGAEWLGEVPKHWTIKAIKWESPVQRGASPRPIDDPVYFEDEGEYAWVRISDVTEAGTYLEKTEQRLSSEGSALSVKLNAGDIFLSIAGSVGKACISRIKCCIHDGFVYFPRWKSDPKFLYYIFASGEPYKGLGKMGTQLNLNTDTVGSIVIGFPGLEEQVEITCFLDAKTAQIDALIDKKRSLIETLKEKRSALISRVVTRGLPPEAAKAAGLGPEPAMKDSGVLWFSELPEHWSVLRLKHISSRTTVGVVVNPSTYVTDDGVPFLLGGDIREFTIDSQNCNRCSDVVSQTELRKSRLVTGDLVVVRVGYPGVAAVVTEEVDGANCASMMIVGRSDRFCSQWLAYAINGQVGRDQVEIVQYGAAQKQFNISHAVDFSFPFPPLDEQRKIAVFLDFELAVLESMVAKVEAVIDRLTEYRQSLITAAVTGKIDVRRIAA